MMRWHAVRERPGKTRVISKFAFLPITLRVGRLGALQIRWLEKVRILQTYSCASYGCGWLDEYFINEDAPERE